MRQAAEFLKRRLLLERKAAHPVYPDTVRGGTTVGSWTEEAQGDSKEWEEPPLY